MDSIETVAVWMNELGPQLDLAEVAASTRGNAWFLARDENTVVDAEYRAEGDGLFLTAEVGPILSAQRDGLYELALQFNFLHMDTGLTVAIDGPGGNLVLQHACGSASLDAESLGGRVAGLFEQVDAWREVLADHASAPAGGDALDLARLQGSIRV